MKKVFLFVIFSLVLLPAVAFAESAIVIDERSSGCKLDGVWADSGIYSAPGCVNNKYMYTSVHPPAKKTGKEKATYTPDIKKAGKYKVEVSWRATENRSSKVTYEVVYSGGSFKKTVNQRGDGHVWSNMGSFPFEAGNKGHVAMISDGGGSACIDAARFTYDGEGGAEPATTGQSSMNEVLGGTAGANSGGSAADGDIKLDASSQGSKTYTFEADGVAVVTPFLETYGNASLSVRVKCADGKEFEWMSWKRADDSDPTPLKVNGKVVPESIKVNGTDPSAAEPADYKYEAKKGDAITLSLEGSFGKANPRLILNVKKK